MSLIVYGDFSCLDCYLAARRVDILAAAGVRVDFRAVEQHPELPVPGRRLSVADEDTMSERCSELQRLLLPGENLPWTMPRFTPKTEAAVSAYAESYGSPVEGDARRLLFELYWREGADIGNPNVLRGPLAGPVLRSGPDPDPLRQIAVSVDRAPITTDAYRRIRTWQAALQKIGGPTLPVVLLGGAVLHGLDALRRLGKEISYAHAEVNPKMPDPRRYPPVDVQPSASWVSQTGGQWRSSHRPGGTPEPPARYLQFRPDATHIVFTGAN